MACVSREQREICLLAVCLSGRSVVAQAAGIRQCDMVCDANCGSQIFVSASVGCLKENGQHGRPATQLHIPPVLRRPILTERSLLPKLWLCITAHAFASVCCHCSVHGCSSYGCSVGVCIGHARLDLLKYRHQLCMQNSNTTCMHSIAVSKQFRGAAQRLIPLEVLWVPDQHTRKQQ